MLRHVTMSLLYQESDCVVFYIREKTVISSDYWESTKTNF